MKILITGVCGFVGSQVAHTLISEMPSAEITGIDNLCRNGSWLNREHLISRGARVVHGDIRNAADLEAIGPFDWVIDAAANPSVLAGVDGNSSSRQLVENNLGGTINLLEGCKRWGAGFILLSTSRVYSIPPLANLKVEVHNRAYRPLKNDLLSDAGIPEQFSTNAPVSLYGATKLTSETLALEYGLTYGFPVWINRCGVMAGARQFGRADQGIFAYWIHSWREGRPLKYIGFDGLGHQVRDCLHPDDLVPLLVKQMNNPGALDTPQVINRIFNVSGGVNSAMSLRQLSDWCAGRFPNSATIDSLPQLESDVEKDLSVRPFDLPWIVLDSTLVRKCWDWQPKKSVEEILEEIALFSETVPDWISTSSG